MRTGISILMSVFLAAMLCVSCSKEPGVRQDGTAVVSFRVSPLCATRASLDGDGAAANVNRYVMEVYTDAGDFYRRVEKTVPDGTLETTMEVRLVVGQVYSFLFWADCSDNGADLLYDTHSDGDHGLRSVTMKGEYAGNSDTRDAFCKGFTENVETAFSRKIILTRPFAQLNVITDDIDDIPLDYMLPSRVSVSFNAYRSFNVLAGEPVGSKSPVSYSSTPYYQVYRTSELSTARSSARSWTLSMDYLFASSEKTVDSVDFEIIANGKSISHSCGNIPFQKNYRTNIFGGLLSEGCAYSIIIDPEFTGEFEALQ